MTGDGRCAGGFETVCRGLKKVICAYVTKRHVLCACMWAGRDARSDHSGRAQLIDY